jgi:hypothetical protein
MAGYRAGQSIPRYALIASRPIGINHEEGKGMPKVVRIFPEDDITLYRVINALDRLSKKKSKELPKGKQA